jgi:hypothetical protein
MHVSGLATHQQLTVSQARVGDAGVMTKFRAVPLDAWEHSKNPQPTFMRESSASGMEIRS